VANFSIRLTFADELEYFGREPICLDALTGSPTENDTALLSGGDTRSNPLSE
jgi:hypothetical protein